MNIAAILCDHRPLLPKWHCPNRIRRAGRQVKHVLTRGSIHWPRPKVARKKQRRMPKAQREANRAKHVQRMRELVRSTREQVLPRNATRHREEQRAITVDWHRRQKRNARIFIAAVNVWLARNGYPVRRPFNGKRRACQPPASV